MYVCKVVVLLIKPIAFLPDSRCENSLLGGLYTNASF